MPTRVHSAFVVPACHFHEFHPCLTAFPQLFPVLHVVQLSLDEIGAGVFWLRLWLLSMLTLQLCQLPHRILLQRQVVLIAQGNQEEVANKLTTLVQSRRWLAVKYIGYVVYACFTVGVVMSYYFSVRFSLASLMNAWSFYLHSACLEAVPRVVAGLFAVNSHDRLPCGRPSHDFFLRLVLLHVHVCLFTASCSGFAFRHRIPAP